MTPQEAYESHADSCDVCVEAELQMRPTDKEHMALLCPEGQDLWQRLRREQDIVRIVDDGIYQAEEP